MPTAADSDIDDLIRRLRSLEPVAPAAGRVCSDLAAAAFHKTRRPGDRPVVALVGGTGVGKSSIVNRVVGADVTATSFRRTFTAGPVAVADADLPVGFLALPHVASDGPSPRGQADRVVVVRRDGPLVSRVVLLDSPDVDGEKPDHHAVADRVFRWADAVAFVVTPEKYQMTELQPYYRLAQRYAIPAVYVMNKADTQAVVDDYAALLGRSGVADAVVKAVPRDDATWQPPADQQLTADDFVMSPSASRAGQTQRLLDATARAGDQVLQPLTELRTAVDRAVGSVRAFAGDAVDVDVHPLTQQLQHRMRDRSVLYLMGPQRILDRVRTAPATLVRLPQSVWGWARGGEFKFPSVDSPNRGEPPDFTAVVTEQFRVLQSRIDDVIGQSPALVGKPPAWKIDPLEAGKIAADELAQLQQWLETRWNKNPRDTALLMKLLRVVPGGDRVTKMFETAPYLLAAACLMSSHMMGHVDMLVLGGWAAVTGVMAKLSDEVAGRTRQTNAAIAARYETLATRQIDAAAAWLDALAPPARTLDAIAASIDRVRAA